MAAQFPKLWGGTSYRLGEQGTPQRNGATEIARELKLAPTGSITEAIAASFSGARSTVSGGEIIVDSPPEAPARGTPQNATDWDHQICSQPQQQLQRPPDTSFFECLADDNGKIPDDVQTIHELITYIQDLTTQITDVGVMCTSLCARMQDSRTAKKIGADLQDLIDSCGILASELVHALEPMIESRNLIELVGLREEAKSRYNCVHEEFNELLPNAERFADPIPPGTSTEEEIEEGKRVDAAMLENPSPLHTSEDEHLFVDKASSSNQPVSSRTRRKRRVNKNDVDDIPIAESCATKRQRRNKAKELAKPKERRERWGNNK